MQNSPATPPPATMASTIDLSAFEGMSLRTIVECAFDILDHICPRCLSDFRKEKNNFSQHVGVNKCVASSKKPSRHTVYEGGTDIPVEALAVMAVYILELDAVKKKEYAAYTYVGVAAFLCHVLKARNLLPVPEASQLQPAQLPPSSELVKMARKQLRQHYQLQPDEEWKAVEEELPGFVEAGKDPSPALAQLYSMVTHMVSKGRNSAAHRAAVLAAHQQPPELRWIPEEWDDLQVLLALALLLEGEPEASEEQMSMASLLDEASLSDAEDTEEVEDEDEAAESELPASASSLEASGSKGKGKGRALANASATLAKRPRAEVQQELQRMEEEMREELKNASGREGFIDFMDLHVPKSAAEINNQGGSDDGNDAI